MNTQKNSIGTFVVLMTALVWCLSKPARGDEPPEKLVTYSGFWAKFVDQDGNPIPNVKVVAGAYYGEPFPHTQRPMQTGKGQRFDLRSDKDGNIDLPADGEMWTQVKFGRIHHRHFRLPAHEQEDQYRGQFERVIPFQFGSRKGHVPNPENRTLIKLWDVRGAPLLYVYPFSKSLPFSPGAIPVIVGHDDIRECVLEVWIEKVADENARRGFSPRLTFKAINGEVRFADPDDEFQFLAPETGWKDSVSHTSIESPAFDYDLPPVFFRTKDGSKYGVARWLIGDPDAEEMRVIRGSLHINQHGSRDLRYLYLTPKDERKEGVKPLPLRMEDFIGWP